MEEKIDAPHHQSHMDEQQAQGQWDGLEDGGGEDRMKNRDKRGVELL